MAPTADPPSAEYLAESKVTLLNVFYSIPIALEVISTVFRLWVKAKPSGGTASNLAFDDYLMIFATISAVGVCISGLVYGPPYGLGRHRAAVPDEDVKQLLIGDYIFSHFYDVAIATTKLSVLALYYRIFSTRKLRAVIIATAVLVGLWLIAMEVVLGLGCRPIKAWWGDTSDPFTCVNKVHFTYFTNIMNLTLDLWIFAMPIPIILSLQVTKDRRLSLIFLFSVGLATCAISAARLTFVFGVGSPDFTWTMAGLGILSAWEPCGGILCANLPLVYRAILQIARSVRDTVGGTKPRDGETANSQRPSQAALSHDWTRLNNSDNMVSSRDGLAPSSLDKSDAALHQYELNSVAVSKGNY